jgi:hypothetical protein
LGSLSLPKSVRIPLQPFGLTAFILASAVGSVVYFS